MKIHYAGGRVWHELTVAEAQQLIKDLEESVRIASTGQSANSVTYTQDQSFATAACFTIKPEPK